MTNKLISALLLIPALFLITSCSENSSTSSTDSASTNQSSANNSETNSSSCQREYGENLLKNPEFAQADTLAVPTDWDITQHTGQTAFELTVSGNVAKIQKIDEQPWFTFAQFLDAKLYSKKTLSMSAELKLNLTQSPAHAFKPGGGIQVSLWAQHADAFIGETLVLSSVLEHEPHIGQTDWQKAEVVFSVPENATRLKAGFLHQADGDMSIRSPSLRVIEKDCP